MECLKDYITEELLTGLEEDGDEQAKTDNHDRKDYEIQDEPSIVASNETDCPTPTEPREADD